jgi:hypothetical protein
VRRGRPHEELRPLRRSRESGRRKKERRRGRTECRRRSRRGWRASFVEEVKPSLRRLRRKEADGGREVDIERRFFGTLDFVFERFFERFPDEVDALAAGG